MGDRIKEFVTRDFTTEEMVNFFIYLTITIMPFIVVKKYSPHYVVGKVIFLYVIGAILLFILLKEKVFKFKNISLESKIALIFFVGLTLSTVFGVAKKTALLGNDERYEGLLVYGIYLLLFLGAIKYLKINKFYIRLTLIMASVMGIYSIFQYKNIDPVYNWSTGKPGVIGAFGFIGNRNFFGTYALIFLILAVGCYLFLEMKDGFLYSNILFGALLVAQTRGTWIAALVLMIGIVIYFFSKEKKQLKKILFLLISFLFVFLFLNLINNNQVLNRGKTLTTEVKNLVSEDKEVRKTAGSNRLGIWMMTLKSIKENPILGSGPDTLHHRIYKYCEEEYDKFIEKGGYYIDKAHNEFLEYWACGGIITLIAYLVLIGIILKNLIKNFEDDKCKILFLIIVGYLIQSFFNISVIQVAPIYWITLGAAVKCYKIEGLVTKNFKSYFFIK